MADKERPTCPRCGAEAVPLLYGEPTIDAARAVEGGEAVSAGCLWEPGSPSWERRNGHRF
jgi:hypothetical protein